MLPKQALLAKLTKIFADAVVDDDEKAFPPGYRAALVDPPRRSTDTKPGS